VSAPRTPLDTASSPAPWTCKEPGSFAWRTWHVRWPAILDDTIARNTTRLDDAARAALAALRDEVAHQPMRALVDDDPWWRDAAAPHVGRPWHDAPWYFAESYLYRRVLEATRFFDNGVDPFLPVKLDEERAMLTRVRAAREALGDDVAALLHASLWGNRADLSYAVGRAFGDSGAADDLLVDHTALAMARLDAAKRVAIVLDNAGTELAFDLLLAHALMRDGHEVVLHAKAHPFFVSDATVVDVKRTSALLTLDGHNARVCDHAHWTSSGFFFTNDMPRDLVDELATCDVVILKGDANYRRLVGDAPWPHDTPVTTAMHFPRPLIALRTCKAEVVVGVARDVALRARARDEAWLVNGRFGLIQCA
jgi:uncharacterized protein with ATP-grasp and redox domains